jgi:cation:H+ antiporter
MVPVEEYFKFILGLALVLVGSELFVGAAARLSALARRSRLFIGLTLVAFGTSAPELAIGVFGVLKEEVGVGLGNVVGSNILNILFVFGLTALIRPITVKNSIIKRDLPMLFGLGILFSLIALDGVIYLIEAFLLGGVMIVYLLYMTRVSKSRGHIQDSEKIKSLEMPMFGKRLSGILLLIVLAFLFLTIGSHLTVVGAVSIATGLGVSKLTIGLTLVAMGTSLPEIVTSLAAIRRKEQDLAIGNVIGSCIFNIIAIPAIMTMVESSRLPVDADIIFIDLPIMILAIIVCLPIFFSEHKISRQEGVLFLIYYAAYTLILYIRESTYTVLDKPVTILGVLGAPMIVFTMVIVSMRALEYRRFLKRTGGNS